MQLQPYLVFEGRCEEALEFYTKAVGAKVEMLMRFKDNPEPMPADKQKPGIENKVMHSSVRIGETVFSASDGRMQNEPKFQGFMLSLTVSTTEEVDRYFTALGDGGHVTMPLSKTFFSPRFGMLTDRFGISWLVYVRK